MSFQVSESPLLAPVVALAGVLLANVPAGGIEDWAKLTGTLGAFGILGWYLWYDVKYGRPRIAKEQALAFEGQRQSYKDELSQQRLHYEAILARIEQRHEREHQEHMNALREITKSIACRYNAT